jgi:HK97 family phage prohead protease
MKIEKISNEIKQKIANGEVKYKAMPALLVGSDEENGTISHIVNTMGLMDDVDDIMYNGSFESAIKANGPQSGRNRINCLWMHDWNEPIGKPLEMRELSRNELPEQILNIAPTATGGLFIKTKLANTSRGRDAYALIKEGVGEWSIGFFEQESQRDEKGINHIKKVDLIEYSFVNRGANYATGTLSVKADEPQNMTEKQLENNKTVSKDESNNKTKKQAKNHALENVKNKAVVPYQNLPLMDEDMTWDAQDAETKVRQWAGGAENLEDMDWGMYQKAFVMLDNANPESVGSYKLQIATVENGELKAVPRGIFAAAAALQGARTPIVEFESGDVDKSKNHIKRYYDRMERVAPWERQSSFIDSEFEEIRSKTNEPSEVLTQFITKAGRVISAATRERLEASLQDIRSALQSAQSAMEQVEALIADNTPSQEENLVEEIEPMSTLQANKNRKARLAMAKIKMMNE